MRFENETKLSTDFADFRRLGFKEKDKTEKSRGRKMIRIRSIALLRVFCDLRGLKKLDVCDTEKKSRCAKSETPWLACKLVSVSSVSLWFNNLVELQQVVRPSFVFVRIRVIRGLFFENRAVFPALFCFCFAFACFTSLVVL